MRSNKRPCRPTREERSRKALAGIDLDQCDTRKVLRQIAMDETLHPSARVAACRELNAMAEAQTRSQPLMGASRAESEARDVNERAISMMAGKRPN